MSTSITSLSRAERQGGRGLHAALWIAQILLALLFGMAGILKSTTPLPVLAQKPEPVTIRAGGTTSIELQTPLYVAMSQGYLAEEGLRLDNVMLGPGRLTSRRRCTVA